MPRLQKRDSNWTKALQLGLKMGLTNQYLASGMEFLEVHNGWRVGYRIVGKVIIEVCDTIIADLK